jgi:hypothetical protein
MSHFTVMVVTPSKPTSESIAEIMQPFHEFECTGVSDQYVVKVDQMAEARTEYEKDTESMYRDPAGNLHKAYEDEFYRDPTPSEKILMGSGPHGCGGNGAGLSWDSRNWKDGSGYHTRLHFLPEGWTEEDVPVQQLKTFGSYIEGWYGYKRLDEFDTPDLEDEHKHGWYRENSKGEVIEVVKRTNPNSKWDFFQIGGRWKGMIRLKPGIKGGAWNGERSRWDDDPQAIETFDSARKGDIDIEGLRAEARAKAANAYDKIHAAIDPYLDSYETWETIMAKYPDDISRARTEYHAQPIMLEFKKVEDDFFSSIDTYLTGRDEYLNRASLRGFQTFALLMGGNWAERGQMGMFATVSNEDQSWESNFAAIIEGIPEDHWLTIVDCHI